jgi:hypothetical protein
MHKLEGEEEDHLSFPQVLMMMMAMPMMRFHGMKITKMT